MVFGRGVWRRVEGRVLPLTLPQIPGLGDLLKGLSLAVPRKPRSRQRSLPGPGGGGLDRISVGLEAGGW